MDLSNGQKIKNKFIKLSVGHRPRFETSRLDEKQVEPHFISDHPVWQSSLIS